MRIKTPRGRSFGLSLSSERASTIAPLTPLRFEGLQFAQGFAPVFLLLPGEAVARIHSRMGILQEILVPDTHS